MVMFCSDIFPKGVNTPQFCFPRHRNAKPCVFQIGIKIQQIGALGKEQELMLWIFTDLCKYLVSPFRLPSGQIAHAGKKKVLRTFLFHHPELTRKEFRVSEVINHNCKTRSEFIEKALRFYMGYLGSCDTTEYLSKALVTMIRGTLENHNNRLRSLLFKWCVELNMMCHTIAAHFRADPIDRKELRAYAVDEVKRTNGQISFSNALDTQRRLGEDDDWQD